jgi:hypothetical protein
VEEIAFCVMGIPVATGWTSSGCGWKVKSSDMERHSARRGFIKENATRCNNVLTFDFSILI